MNGGHTIIGVLQEALKEEKSREEETTEEISRRREMRKSLNRRVSFASHATIRYVLLWGILTGRLFPQAGTTPSPKKGVGFSFEQGTPSTDGESTGTISPISATNPGNMPESAGADSDSDETSMDIADDNLTLPLPSALIKRQLQRGVGFLVNDGDDEEMDETQTFGQIIPSRDGVNRFLSDLDNTVEFTYQPQATSAKNVFQSGQDDTVDMDFTRVHPTREDTVEMDFTQVFSKQSSPRKPIQLVDDDTVGMDFTHILPQQQNSPRKPIRLDEDTVEMDFTKVMSEQTSPRKPIQLVDEDTIGMDFTHAISEIRAPSYENTTQEMHSTHVPPRTTSNKENEPPPPRTTPKQNDPHTKPISPQPTPQSSPFLTSPVRTSRVDADITRSPLSTGPQRTPQRGLLAITLLTTPSRRKSDSVILGSPRAADRFRSRKSLGVGAGVEGRRVSIGREAWGLKEFGGDNVIGKGIEERNVRDMIARLTPKPSPRKLSPMKISPVKIAIDGIVKSEEVQIWKDEEEEDGFEPITLAEFLAMTNISFLDGLGPSSTRRRTVLLPSITSPSPPTLSDYAKAGAVLLPILSLYQFVLSSWVV